MQVFRTAQILVCHPDHSQRQPCLDKQGFLPSRDDQKPALRNWDSQQQCRRVRDGRAYKNGKQQDSLIKELMAKHDIEAMFDNGEIDTLIRSVFAKNFEQKVNIL